MNQQREAQLMRDAIEEAKKSQPEDNRPRPKVGAILADENGEILCRSYRGEEEVGGHAEFHIFRKAKREGVSPCGKTLFVTLEPCTRRGEGKIPCAIRVAESGIKRIVIGTLDPNPHITGHGEMYLSYQMEVDRFPGELARELQALNKPFFDQHRNNQIPAVSLYAGGISAELQETFRPALAGQREGILQQSMDLMAGTSKDIFIFAGDLSWLRELQMGLVLAKTAGRSVKILCDKVNSRKEDFYKLTEIARRLGADIGLSDQEIPIRGTLVSTGSDEAAMMCVERRPAKHAVLFQAPHETGIIKAMALWADDIWKAAQIKPAFKPVIDNLDPSDIAKALKRGIPQYANAELKVCEIKVDRLKPLTTSLERFKLFRLNQVGVFQQLFKTDTAIIKGSPWPIFPPVVEQLQNGECVIIDGSHRVFSAMQRGVDMIQIILVTGNLMELPAIPLDSWDEVKLRTEKLPRDKRYKQFKPDAFRDIRSVVSKYVSQLI
jgi:pyrimidine deaminase RibD-like protein